MEPTRERRTHPRAVFTNWVEITAGEIRCRATGRDLSASGLGAALRMLPPPVETRVTSEFALPGISLPVALDGVVIWSDPYASALGVRFEGIDPGLGELIASFVAGRL